MISEQIKRNIKTNQSPNVKNCENIKKLYCKLPPAGFGCQIHYIISCLQKGYFAKTLIVINNFLNNYLVKSNATWDQFISPLSETCQPNYNFENVIKNQSDIIKITGK